MMYLISLSGLMGHQQMMNHQHVPFQQFMSNPDTRLVILDKASLYHLQESKDPLHLRILDNLDPNHNLSSVVEAMEAVAIDPNLGLLVDRRMAEYQMSHHQLCDRLTIMQKDLGLNRHYALALPQGSPYKDTLSNLVLKYNENGVLNHLRKKWFTSETDKACLAGSHDKPGAPVSVHVSDFNGQSVLLLLSVVGSVSLAFLELLCYSSSACKKSHSTHRNFCQTLKEEVKMAL